MKVNKKIAILLSVFLMGSVVIGCSNKTESKDDSNQTPVEETTTVTTKDDYTYENNDYFTSVSWLEKNKSNENIIIIDARDADSYNKGHIPGAINVAWQSLAKMDGKGGDPGWGTLQDKEALSTSLSNLGITKDSKVVVYASKGGWGDDGRLVWCLQAAGVDARILNGGFDIWTAENLETNKDAVTITPSNFKVEEISTATNITTDEIKSNIENLKIIDTREADEYKGATKYGEVRGGHLPGAINISFNDFYAKDGSIKTNEEIDKIMSNAGISKDDAIVTYCTAGIRSAHMALVLKNAGYENVRNYDASYHEWAGDSSLEVE